MANEIVLRESFDAYSAATAGIGFTTKWTAGGNGSMVAGRFGGQALSVNPGTGVDFGYWRPFDTAIASNYMTIGFAFKNAFTAGWGGHSIAGLRTASGNYDMAIGSHYDGSLSIRRKTAASASTVLATSALGLVTGNVWYYYELELYRHATLGEARLYLDGNPTPVCSVAGANTINAAGFADRLMLGQSSSSGDGIAVYDDVYVKEGATRLGPQRMRCLPINANVGTQSWVPSTGTDHAALVDETLPSFTDYLQGSTVGDIEELGFADLANFPDLISDVNLIVYAMKTDAGARAINLGISDGVTPSLGVDTYLAQTAARYERGMNINPITGLAWTRADINALRAYLKVAA